jgi:hypothetical protein
VDSSKRKHTFKIGTILLPAFTKNNTKVVPRACGEEFCRLGETIYSLQRHMRIIAPSQERLPRAMLSSGASFFHQEHKFTRYMSLHQSIGLVV